MKYGKSFKKIKKLLKLWFYNFTTFYNTVIMHNTIIQLFYGLRSYDFSIILEPAGEHVNLTIAITNTNNALITATATSDV